MAGDQRPRQNTAHHRVIGTPATPDGGQDRQRAHGPGCRSPDHQRAAGAGEILGGQQQLGAQQAGFPVIRGSAASGSSKRRSRAAGFRPAMISAWGGPIEGWGRTLQVFCGTRAALQAVVLGDIAAAPPAPPPGSGPGWRGWPRSRLFARAIELPSARTSEVLFQRQHGIAAICTSCSN